MSMVINFTIQVASAILCFALVRFMFKPYEFTSEGRYLGLPLGFMFLGIAEIFLGAGIFINVQELNLFSLILRTFAYVFLAATYYFSRKPTKNSRIIWNITFSLIIVTLIALLIVIVNGAITISQPMNPSIYFRAIALTCIGYICLHTLRSHKQNPKSDTMWIPIGFILLSISQYSLLIWASDANYVYGVAFTGGWIARIVGLSIFVAISYLTLYNKPEKP